ncbi:MAG: PQQ-binding-like beta-propeller repeat protein, partial [Gammaproteobacteria bacterium]
RCNGLQYCEPGISAAVTAIPGAVIAGHMDGRVRAYDRASGKVLWETETRQPFTTVNGVQAAGGSIGGGAGPVVQHGRLLVTSGYGLYYHLPGNVLLVYAPE